MGEGREETDQGQGPARGGAMGAVLFVGLLSGLGYGLIFPVAALYGEAAGLSPALITALIAVHPLMRLLSGPLWGRAADTLGRRPVLLTGVALAAAGHLIFGLAGGPLGLGLGRLLTGLGSGETVAAMAVVADLTSVQDRAKGLGQMRAAVGLGMLLGPVLGGALGLVSLNLPGLAAAAVSVCCFAMVWRRLPETRPVRAPVSADQAGVEQEWNMPVRALVIVGAASASITLAEAIVPLAIEHVLVPRLGSSYTPAFFVAAVAGLSGAQVALLLTVGLILAWGFSTVLFDGFLSARIVGRLGELRTLVLGLVLWAMAFALTPSVYLWGVVPGGIVVAATAIPVSLSNVSLSTWLSRRAGPDGQGRLNGAAQSALATGEVLGPLAAGWLYSQFYGLPYLVASALLVAMVLVALSLPRAPLSSAGS